MLKDKPRRWSNYGRPQPIRNSGNRCLSRGDTHPIANATANKRWRQTGKFKLVWKRLGSRLGYYSRAIFAASMIFAPTKPGVDQGVSLVVSHQGSQPYWQVRAEATGLRAPGRPVMVIIVRSLAIILITLLLPISLSAPSAMACSTPACCGANCSERAPLNQVSCCKAPIAPDKASNRARDAQNFDSIGTMPLPSATIAISHSRNIVAAREYSPPDRLASLALLCSRQI